MEPFTEVHNSGNRVFGLILQHIFDEGEGVHIGQGSLIKLAVVHYEARFAFFFLRNNKTVARPLGGGTGLNQTTSQRNLQYLLVGRGVLPLPPYRLLRIGFSVRIWVKFS